MVALRPWCAVAIVVALGCRRAPSWVDVEGPQRGPAGPPGSVALRRAAGPAAGDSGAVVVVVRDSRDSAALAGSVVEPDSVPPVPARAAPGTVADRAGQVMVRAAAGAHRLRVRSVCYEPRRANVAVRPGVVDTLVVWLQADGYCRRAASRVDPALGVFPGSAGGRGRKGAVHRRGRAPHGHDTVARS